MLVQAVDLAISLSQEADYTVILTMAGTRTGERLVLDVFRDRIPGPGQGRRRPAVCCGGDGGAKRPLPPAGRCRTPA